MRYVTYIGIKATITAVMAILGADISNYFGRGIFPYSFLSLPWDTLKNAYVSVFGNTIYERESGSKGLIRNLRMLIPGYHGWYEKARDMIQNIERGYRVTREGDMALVPTSTVKEILGFLNLGPQEAREAYDLMRSMSEERGKYTIDRKKYILEGVVELEKGRSPINVIRKAQKNGIPISVTDIQEAYRQRQTLTALEKRAMSLPKALRKDFLDKVRKFHEETWGSPMVKPRERSMWSSVPESSLEEYGALSEALESLPTTEETELEE